MKFDSLNDTENMVTEENCLLQTAASSSIVFEMTSLRMSLSTIKPFTTHREESHKKIL